MSTVREALAAAAEKLRAASVGDSEREAAWLLAHVLECSAGALRLRAAESLEPQHGAALQRLVNRRAAHEPIQYVLGTAEFLGHTLRVTPAVLIPRLDTETLVEAAAERLQGRGSVQVADIGTGSGAIAIGLASLLPQARLVATDISADALAIAGENAAAAGFSDRIRFRQGDLVAALVGLGPFDAILSNPPYIDESEWRLLDREVREYEPRLALTPPGSDALLYYRRLAEEAQPLLTPSGILGVEVGYNQARAVANLFEAAGLSTEIRRDTAAIERVVIGSRIAR